LEYKKAEEFLADLRKEFREKDEEVVKVTELKNLEQGEKTIEEFVQEFRREVKRSSCEERLLIKEFK